jgi:SAM-dependent methyltransferase
MSQNPASYDIHPAVAEVYDRHETQTSDVDLIRRLIGSRTGLRILEPFCGTGRILLPLAEDGHEVVGLDVAVHMLDRARRKTERLPPETRRRVTLRQADVVAGGWPAGFDLVVLAGNCMYELADAAEQEGCIAFAAAAVKPGGHVFVDSDHMETPLPESWTTPGLHRTRWPSGLQPDGCVLESYCENLDCDAQARVWRARHTILVRHPDGRTETFTHLQQKHPVSHDEVAGWLTAHGLAIEQSFGDHAGNPYTPDAPRATFWARKEDHDRD